MQPSLVPAVCAYLTSKWLLLDQKLQSIPWEIGASREGIPAFQILNRIYNSKASSSGGLVVDSERLSEAKIPGIEKASQGVRRETIVKSSEVLCEKTQDDTARLYPLNFAANPSNRAVLYPTFVQIQNQNKS